MRHKSSAPEVVILGAGPAGIGAGIALGSRALVLEQAAEAGGLSRTIEWNGAVFEIGGHSFHTPHPEVRALVESAVELFEQRRDARCFSHGCLIPYPFQKNFRQLGDAAVVRQCEQGLAAKDSTPAKTNFLQFLESRFGAGIAEQFMVPYNQKLWGPRLQDMAADWVGERVAAPEGVRESFEERGGKRKPLQPETRVAYPARGGFGVIMTELAKRCADARYGQRIVQVDLDRRTVLSATGEQWPYQKLVSTLPLPSLLNLCLGVPEEVKQACARLEVLSLKVALIVVDHPIDTPIQRIYCADDTVPAHKVAFNHNSSDFLRAKPRHGIMAEISCANDEVRTDEELIEWTLSGLRSMGVIGAPETIVSSRMLNVKYGYPVPSLQRDRLVEQIRAWLGDHQIATLGRFGEWAYINSDEALHRGMSLGGRL